MADNSSKQAFNAVSEPLPLAHDTPAHAKQRGPGVIDGNSPGSATLNEETKRLERELNSQQPPAQKISNSELELLMNEIKKDGSSKNPSPNDPAKNTSYFPEKDDMWKTQKCVSHAIWKNYGAQT